MRRLVIIAILSSFFLSSCGLFGKRVRGTGNIVTQSRSITGYNSVDVSGNIDVYVKQDPGQAVKVETDDNIQGLVEVYEEGGVLHIRSKRGYNLNPSRGIKVFVAGTEFRRFEASGSCDIYSENMITSSGSVDIDLSGSCDASLELRAPKVTADISGSGSVFLKGETRDLSVDGTGSSSFKCMELKSENVDVDITGSGSAEVFASVKLNVDVTGSGSVKYMGSASVSQKVSGSGSVRKVE